MSIEAMKQALEKIATVNAMDYEYQRWAREALAATEESSATQEPVATVTNETGADITMSWWHEPALPIGTKLYTHPQPKAEQEPKRDPLTDEQFLELLLRKGSTELVGYSTFVSNSIQMQGRTGLLQGAKLLKEFVEAAHGIKGEA